MKNIETVELAMSSSSPLGEASLEEPTDAILDSSGKNGELMEESDNEISFKAIENGSANPDPDQEEASKTTSFEDKPLENESKDSRASSPQLNGNSDHQPADEMLDDVEDPSAPVEKEELKEEEVAKAQDLKEREDSKEKKDPEEKEPLENGVAKEDATPMEVESAAEDTPVDKDTSSPEPTLPQAELSGKEAEKEEADAKVTEPLANSGESPGKKSEICLEPLGPSSSEDSDEESLDKSTAPSSQEEPANSATEATKDKSPEDKNEETVDGPPTIDLEGAIEEEPKEQVVDYKKALEELSEISTNARKINEEDGSRKVPSGVKRTLSTESHEDSKKPKLDKDEKVEDARTANQEVKKCLQKFSRQELEEIVLQKFADALSAQSEAGELRRKLERVEEDTEKWKKKTQLLQKMCSDLNTVMRRFIVDVQNKPDERVTPIKITRSVGLQVVTDRGRKATAPSTQMATKTTGAAIPPQARPSVQNPSAPVAKPIPAPKPIAPKPTVTYGKPALQKPVNVVVATTTTSRLQGLPPSVSIIHNSTQMTQSITSTPTSAVQSPPTGGNSKKVIDIVDLSDEEDDKGTAAIAPPKTNGLRLVPTSHLKNTSAQIMRVAKHPAPLPDPPRSQPQGMNMKAMPPKPILKISRLNTGIVLSWNMTVSPSLHAVVGTYQIYAYQETIAQTASSALWKKVGDVKALPLPMACTLTQFSKGNKYHFAVRAKDVHGRVGFFSEPQSIALT